MTYTWYGPPAHDGSWPSGDWESPENWAPGGPGSEPGAGASVVLNGAHTGNVGYSVDVSSAIAVASLAIGAGITLNLTTGDGIEINNANGLNIASGGVVDMQVPNAGLFVSGDLKNAGEIDGGIIFLDGAVRLTNGGTIDGSQLASTGGGPPVSLVNVNETLSDDQIGDGTFAFTNAAGGLINGGLDASVNTGSFAFSNAGSISLLRNALAVTSDTLKNTGTISVDGDSGGDAVLVFSGSTVLNGGGSVTLAGGDGYITGEGGTLTNSNNIISGYGEIGDYQGGAYQLAFTNAKNGVVDADDLSGGVLTLDTDSNALTNAGLMEATGSGGLLILDSANVSNSGTIESLDSATLTIDNSSIANSGFGIVGALGANSTLSLNDAVIEGGEVESVAGSTIAVAGYDSEIDAIAQAMQNAGSLVIGADAALTLGGEITNTGSISVTSADVGDGYLEIDANGVLLDGGGTLTLADGGVITGADGSGFDLLYNYDNTISGDGYLGNDTHNNQLNFFNGKAGTVDATDGNSLTIDTGFANIMANGGLMEATGTGDLTIQHTYAENNGTIEALDSGTVTLDNSILENTASGTVGALSANSTLVLDDSAIVAGLIGSVSGSTITVEGNDNSIDALSRAMENLGTLSIAANDALALGGTVDNRGAISVASTVSAYGYLEIDDNSVTLRGGGTVTLADGVIAGADSSGSDFLTNMDNTISGGGFLGNDGPASQLGFSNRAAGTVDATDGNTLVAGTGSNTLQNAGLMEATGSGQLVIQDTVSASNSGTIEALGSASVSITDSGLTNTGTLEASGGTLTDDSALVNRGTLIAQTGGKLTLDGVVSSFGTAQINDGGTLEFGATAGSGQTITFAPNAQGELVLDDSKDFHATVVGMTTSGKATIDLTDIHFSGTTRVVYTANGANTGGIVIVSDGTDTAKIQVTGSYVAANFTIQNDGNGGTLLKDPPVASPLPSAPSDLAAADFPTLGFGGAGVAGAQPDALTTGFGKSPLDHLAMAL